MSQPSSMYSMERLALEFIGSFSQFQSASTDLMRRHLKSVSPELLPLLEKRWLKHIRDEDRVAAIRAVARAAGSSADLSNLGEVFNRVKDVRDLMGHSGGMSTAWDGTGWTFAISHRRDDKQARHLPERRDETWLKQLKIDCQWMTAHVDWVLNVADLAIFRNPLTNQVIQVEEPPARPRELLADP